MYQILVKTDYYIYQPSEKSTDVGSWWKNQFWTLFLGLACGVCINMLGRLWVFGRHPAVPASATQNITLKSLSETFKSISTDNKMVLVVRTDISMSKGKVAAQCAHAAVACYKKALKKTPMLLKQWELFGQAKVTLKAPAFESPLNHTPICQSQNQGQGASLEALASEAQSLGIVACIIYDSGRTQIEAGSSTVLGVGPAPSVTIDKVTGNLKLY